MINTVYHEVYHKANTNDMAANQFDEAFAMITPLLSTAVEKTNC